ncbi:TlpA family protein disulfide reductase [Pseudenhygromyxa sp. WMMC2535]|uniref:TlpA family protein disulfide reductase n=1 Tax=Pseudenhygromyxa sp. WMMC2535 TaxID=2712867 RepID=UPI00155187CD|nr:TlpA disulfide reductase family protein [Pseudenhygromyxa sp. WMMC2535]NVB36874.1 TlpA family protein disulfide reductase [Pseudenhygromyxa sp. WMMC2535]
MVEGTPERIVGALLLVLVAVAGALDLRTGITNWDSYGPVGVDEPLPEFFVELSDGEQLASEDLGGQVSLITFWATWCHACGLEMPALAALEDRFAGTQLRIYGVNRDDEPMTRRAAMVEAYMGERGIEFPQIYDDGSMARAFGVEAIPHMVIVGKQGRIRHVHLGRTSERTLAKEIEALLDE